MVQILVVILIIAAAFGIYRCNGPQTADGDSARSNLDATLQAPEQVQEALEQQVDTINQRNREMLDRN